MTDESPTTSGAGEARVVYRQAVEAWREGRKAEALATLKDIVQGRYGRIDGTKTLQTRVLSRSLRFGSFMGRWPDVEQIARLAMQARPQDAQWPGHLGEALLRQGREAEASAALETALALDPGLELARTLLASLRRPSRAPGRPPRPWPNRTRMFEHPRHAIEKYVLRDYPAERFVTPDTVFMTQGSCFAENLAQRLEAAGYVVKSEPIGEDVNSTFANRYLFDWIEHGAVDAPTSVMEEVYGPHRRARLLNAVRTSDVLVFTLGVAPCFFDRDTGDFAFAALGSPTSLEYLQRQCDMRTTTVAENVANTHHILDTVRRLAGSGPRIVLTVSPVSLMGTTEMYSAVVADCLSKSTLRLACHEVVQARADAIYWPSFEMVRWLGPHLGTDARPVFGAEDGVTRHVSEWLVDLIVDLFIQHHSVPAGRAADASPETGP